MSNRVTNLLIFLTGVAIGSVVTWQLVRKEYELIAQAVEATVKEEVEEYVSDGDEEDMDEYYDILESQGYVETAKPEETESRKEPYVISPDEFQEDIGYTAITFYYFADGVLTDENQEIVEDVENSIGYDSLNHFGDYEEDSVHVRNERLRCEYEVLLDQRTYEEVAKTKPHPVEVE